MKYIRHNGQWVPATVFTRSPRVFPSIIRDAMAAEQLDEALDLAGKDRESVAGIVPAVGLGVSLYLLFFTLTPTEYRASRYPKWPGALFTAVWWLGVTTALPPILRGFFTYDLTYGSMAGIIIALFFFWLVGLGLVIGAELNAALAEPGEDGRADKETQI